MDEPDESTDQAEQKTDEQQQQQPCRMYEPQFPSEGEVVMVRIDEIEEVSARVSLLEYNHLPGMILWSDVTRKRVRSVHRLLHTGRIAAMTVLRVDRDKGYIDLSRRELTREDMANAKDRYAKAKLVHSILSHVATACQVPLIDLCQRISWPLYRQFGHAHQAFLRMARDPVEAQRLLTPLTCELPPAVMPTLIKTVLHRLKPQAIKVRTTVEVTCVAPDGIHAIKAALAAGKQRSTPHIGLDIRVIAAPRYVITGQCESTYAEDALELLRRATADIAEVIRQKGGEARCHLAPKIVCASDEQQLKKLMDAAAQEAREVPADDEIEDD